MPTTGNRPLTAALGWNPKDNRRKPHELDIRSLQTPSLAHGIAHIIRVRGAQRRELSGADKELQQPEKRRKPL
jgi:hypothetical protein